MPSTRRVSLQHTNCANWRSEDRESRTAAWRAKLMLPTWHTVVYSCLSWCAQGSQQPTEISTVPKNDYKWFVDFCVLLSRCWRKWNKQFKGARSTRRWLYVATVAPKSWTFTCPKIYPHLAQNAFDIYRQTSNRWLHTYMECQSCGAATQREFEHEVHMSCLECLKMPETESCEFMWIPNIPMLGLRMALQ